MQNIWTDYDLDILLESREFPAICPNCHKKEAHTYIQAYSQRGAFWAWCSHCNVFEHAAIIAPSYWKNDTFIDANRLCALPDYLETQKEKIDIYLTENYKGMDFDYCNGCMRHPDIYRAICPRCHAKNAKAQLEGHSLVVTCGQCNYEVVGSSFFAPCEKDRTSYNLLIENQSLLPAQIVMLSSRLHWNSLTVKEYIEKSQLMQINFLLNEIMELKNLLDKENIRYEIQPPVQYSQWNLCDLKLL